MSVSDDGAAPDEAETGGKHSYPARRWRWAAALVVVCVAGSLVGAIGTVLLLGDRLRSPDELIAGVEARAAPLVWVEAELRELSDEIVFRAKLTDSSSAAIKLPAGLSGVVTAVNVTNGEKIRAGSVPFEVEGRPVIALPGKFRFYRDLHEGDEGPDVAQMQRALRDIGYFNAEVTGYFSRATTASVIRLYESAGYAPARQSRQADGSVVVPAAELWANPSFPVQVDVVTLKVGRELDGEAKLGKVRSKQVLAGEVPQGYAERIQSGASVIVAGEDGKEIEGTVVSGDLKAPTEEAGEEGSGEAVLVELSRGAKVLADRSYQVTVVGEQTDGAVLAVPLGAVFETPDGTPAVAVLVAEGHGKSGGQVRDVPVKLGVQADGWVEVVPLSSDDLRQGSKVIVGEDGYLPGEDSGP